MGAMVVVAVGLGTVLAAVVALRLVVDWTDAGDVFGTRPFSVRRRSAIAARLVFAEVDDTSFAVDGVLVTVPTELEGQAGTPVSLRFRRPGTWWFAECVGELLQGWAEADEVVELSVAASPAGARATVTNGSSSVTLDLDAAQGLPAAA